MLNRLFAIIASVCLWAGPALAETRPFTARDLAMLDRISDPQLSPDGRYLAYTLRSTDWANNRGVGSLWLHDRRAPGLAPRMLAVSDKAAAAPRWSPDGQTLYFLSARTGSQQVWRTDSDGAIATPVTNLPLSVGTFRLSRDGKTLVVALSVYPDCPDLACTRTRNEARRAGTTALAYDRQTARQWDEWRGPEQNRLYALRLDASGATSVAPVALMRGFDAEAPDRPFGDDSEIAVSETHVYFTALRPGEAWGDKALYRMWAAPLDGSAPPREVAADLPGAVTKPVLSPDGSRLATLRKPEWRDDLRARLHVIDLNTGASREVETGVDRSPDSLMWSSDGRTILATMADMGRTRLYAVDVAAGRSRRLTEAGSVTGVATAPGRLVVVQDSLTSPGQLYEVGANGPVPLARHNVGALAEFAFAPPEQFSFKGWNDETVHGWVMPPQGARPGQRYPVAFLIHGGPHGSFGDSWSYRWNPQVWAGMGYAVVMIDFHGSTGYGEAFARSIIGHWGSRPLEDLKIGWAAVQARYPYLDGTRACALGGSYGGYMTAWIAGAWAEPWRCLVNHAGITDMRSMALSTEIPGFSAYEAGGEVWARPEAHEQHNPLSLVGAWKTPMLVVHGARDFRVPVDQGLMAFSALQRRGVPSRLVVYPDENHWVLKPRNSVDWYAHVEAWMDRWTAPAPTPR